MRFRQSLSGLAALFWLAAAAPQFEETRARLEGLQSELAERAAHQRELAERAEAAGREAEALARRVVALAAEVQATEERVSAAAEKIRTLSAMLAEQEQALDANRAQMARTLAAMQRLSRRPADLALLRPGEAERTLKSAALLRELVPQLQREADAVSEQIDRILALRADLAAQRQALSGERESLAARRAELDAARREREAERRRFLSEAEQETRRMTELADKAETLEGLIAALQAERRRRLAAARDAAERVGERPVPPGAQAQAARTPAVPFSAARGTMPLPARGRLVRDFGEDGEVGAARGITIATVAGAQVVAPYDGRIAFAGPFRGYGTLLIIAHSEGYHTLLAGMQRVYASVGQWVLAGEPVGAMAAEAAIQQDGKASLTDMPQLYVELRKGGDPVNPLPWLAAGLGKVS